MRVPALLVLLLLAPAAAAQMPDLALVELSSDEPALVRPLQGAVTANLTLRVSCALAAEPAGAPVAYAVESAPAWATVVVSPATDVVPVGSCGEDGYATRNATLTITASDQAPAFAPTPIRVSATVGASSRQQKATAETNLTADYFSILDVVAISSSATTAPGGQVVFPVKITNLGNARTRILFEVQDASEGLNVTAPAPLTLEAKQHGASTISGNVDVLARALDAGGLVNRVDTFTLVLRGERAEEPARRGDESRLSFVVTTRSDFSLNGAPGPGLVLVALALAAVAYATRRA